MNLELAPKPASAAQPDSYRSYLRWGMLTIAALVIGVFGWAMMAKINGAVLASGLVEVQGKPKTVQHLDGGIVGEILVENGQEVKAGDVLLRLDPTMLDVNREIVDVQLNETLARVTRLRSERDGALTINWPEQLIKAQSNPRVARAMDGQEKLFNARIAAARGQVSQLRQRVSQLSDQITGLQSLITSQNDQVAKIQQEANAKRTLVEKGYLGEPAVLALEREELRLRGSIQNQESEVNRLKGAIAETREQIRQLDRDRQSEVLTELRAAETEMSGFTERLTAAQSQAGRIEIVSPVDGSVHNLGVTTVGGVIAPGQELMQIIPADAKLIVVAQVLPRDIDQVYPGQLTRVRFSAFNARRTPELFGSVVKVAPDRQIDEMTGFPYYEVEVDVPPEELARLDESLTLMPGMPAESFMQTESRSVLNYILKPATDAMTRAGREE
jgi:HlyD family secretion protein